MNVGLIIKIYFVIMLGKRISCKCHARFFGWGWSSWMPFQDDAFLRVDACSDKKLPISPFLFIKYLVGTVSLFSNSQWMDLIFTFASKWLFY